MISNNKLFFIAAAVSLLKRVLGNTGLITVLVTLAIYFGTQIIAIITIVQSLLIAGVERENISLMIETSVLLQFIFFLIAHGLSIAFLWGFLKYKKITWNQIAVKKPSIDNLIYALPAYAIYFVLFFIAFSLIGAFAGDFINVNQQQQIGFYGASGFFALSAVFVGLVVLPAVVEEIMVRGFLYSGIRSKLSKLPAALLVSTIFAAAHLQLGSGVNPLWISAVDTFILSMVLIWLREKTGNIWAGVVVHMIKNSLAFINLFIIKPF